MTTETSIGTFTFKAPEVFFGKRPMDLWFDPDDLCIPACEIAQTWLDFGGEG